MFVLCADSMFGFSAAAGTMVVTATPYPDMQPRRRFPGSLSAEALNQRKFMDRTFDALFNFINVH